MFSAQTYIDRRQRLRDQLDEGIVLFMGNDNSPMNYDDNCYHFRQDSSFLYFFGIDRPKLGAIMDLDNGHEIIFGDELSMNDLVWTGPEPTLVSLAEKVGIKTTKTQKDLYAFLENAEKEKRLVHYLPPYRAINRYKISEGLSISVRKVVKLASKDLIRAVVSLRANKSEAEIEEMISAVNLSRKLHTKANELCRSGIKESVISGALHEIVISEGGQFPYPPIITVNGQTLHNHYYGNSLEKGRMLLVDAGAEVASHYASDITRTFPVDGKFTDQQREVYSIVLKAQMNAINNCIPGRSFSEVHHLAMIDLASGLEDIGLMKGDIQAAVNKGAHALFCPHGLGHMIGLDVHDMEDLGEDEVGYGKMKRSQHFGTRSLRLARELEPGFVLTVEPGIYFIPELIDIWKSENKFREFIDYSQLDKFRNIGGIRIEDNIAITEDNYQVLGEPIPKQLKEIEF